MSRKPGAIQLLVSPSTLLFVVRTVANLWRQEQPTQNAQEIARRGGELYDKFVGFVEALETVGSRLQQAQRAYEDAHKRLSSGRGRLVRQTEMLRELGVKPGKRIAEGLLDLSHEVAEQSVFEAPVVASELSIGSKKHRVTEVPIAYLQTSWRPPSTFSL